LSKKTASYNWIRPKPVQRKVVVMQAVLWLLCCCLLPGSNRLLAAAAGTFEGSSDGLIVRITGARWMPISEYSPEGNIEGDKRARVLAINYEVEAARDEWLPKTGYSLSQALSILDAEGQVPADVTSGGSWSGNKGRQWWSGLDPRSKQATFQFEILHPDAPPGATGETEENLQFQDVPLPALHSNPVLVNRSLRSARYRGCAAFRRAAGGDQEPGQERIAGTYALTHATRKRARYEQFGYGREWRGARRQRY
jgi:hypothetical protein